MRAGRDRVELHAAVRQRCGVLLAAARERDDADFGYFAIELADFDHAEQDYVEHTAIVATRLYDRHGCAVEIVDFAPRFRQYGRMFCPMTLVRQIRPLSGSPRIRIRLRPACDYGAPAARDHLRQQPRALVMPGLVLRLTTSSSITSILEETQIVLKAP